MLVCIPTSDAAGLDATIHEHFGSAGYFTLYDTDTKEVQVLENRNAHHSHGTCHPMTQLAKYKIGAVLCTGMGRRAVEALNADGIRTLSTEVTSAKEALEKLSEGTLVDIDPVKACHGHGQRAATHGIGPSNTPSEPERAGRGLRGGRHGQGRGEGRGQKRRQDG